MEEKQTRILQAALSLFARQGIHETSTAQIASRASVGTGTFFRYFPSKEDLIHALFHEVTSRLYSGVLPMGITPHVCAGNSSRDKLMHLWMSTAQRALTYADAMSYWVLYRGSIYGKQKLANSVVGLNPFYLVPLQVDEAAMAVGKYSGNGPLAGAHFVGLWQATVVYLQQNPKPWEQSSTLLIQSFNTWWGSLGLD